MSSNRLAHATRRSSAMGPSVRYLLMQYNLKPESITPTGPHHTLLKGDVLAYVNEHKVQPGDQSSSSSSDGNKKTYKSNLDLSGHQPQRGPEGYSRIARELLDM